MPALAESWTITPDGQDYVFKLRPGVKFHDGEAFEATDVKFSIDRRRARTRQQDPGEARSSPRSTRSRWSIRSTVKVTLKKPDDFLLYNLALGRRGDRAIPRRRRPTTPTRSAPAPFKFKDRKEGDSLTLVKAADLSRPVAIKLNTVTFKSSRIRRRR